MAVESVDRFADARTLLAGRLRFADAAAINADVLLIESQSLAERIKDCRHHRFQDTETCYECRGYYKRVAYVDPDDEQCAACDGTGEMTSFCDCIGGGSLDSDLIEEGFRLAGINMPDEVRNQL